jgi:MoaA/NifB/PqqE/SkfB family radical SAM enzyme
MPTPTAPRLSEAVKQLNRQFLCDVSSGTGYRFYRRRRLPLAGLRSLKRRWLASLGVLQLERLFICPTHECNARCPHCYEKFLHESFRKSLTTAQVKSLIDQFRRLGGCWVFFCSGEFLLRKDAVESIAYAHKNNMAVSVTTNGLLLTREKIRELKAAGLTDLIVSIDSAEPARHDALRGVKGCFEKATGGLRMAKDMGLFTEIWTYVTKDNFNELDGISELALELDATGPFVFFPLLSGNLFEAYDVNLTLEERETFRRKYNHTRTILEMPAESSPCRGGGLVHVAVQPSGDVCWCPPVPYSYGNIATKSLRDCVRDIVLDHERFAHCTGQCIVNFPEYRQNCHAKFMYPLQAG